MASVVIGKWGKSLAIRVPLDVARVAGLSNGEAVEIEAIDGDLLIRRRAARIRAQQGAAAAAAEIIAAAKGRTLGSVAIHELRAEGRRG